MATIKDVAKRSGVGTTTVSRVINNSSSVSEDTKNKVLKAMEELNYQPSFLGRGLAEHSTYTIGLVMDNTTDKAYYNPFIYEIFRGIEKVIYEGGYTLLLLGQDTQLNGKLALDVVLQSKRVDGIIIPCEIIKRKSEELLKYKLPIVAIGKLSNINDISWVDTDHYISGYKAAEYLYSRGYRNIAFEMIKDSNNVNVERCDGYIKFIKEKNMDIKYFDGDINGIDSIICLGNLSAYQITQRLREIGKDVPTDIGIITFDSYPLAEFVEPTLTHVDIDLYELGVQAAKEVLRRIDEDDKREILIPVLLNARKSTK